MPNALASYCGAAVWPGEEDTPEAAQEPTLVVIVESFPGDSAIHHAQDGASISHDDSSFRIRERNAPKCSSRVGWQRRPGHTRVGGPQDRAGVSHPNCGLRIDEGDRPKRVGCAARLQF